MKKINFKKLMTALVHLLLTGVLLVFFLPIALWSILADYLPGMDLLGIDSSHFSYFVAEYSRRLPLPPSGWKMTWWEGIPQVNDYPWLNFYLIQPLVGWLGVLPATKIYPVFFLFLFLLFSYFLFWRLSKNFFLSFVLAICLSRSYAVYIQWYDAGVGLSSIAQVSFPLVFYFLIGYIKEKKGKLLAGAILSLGFGFYTHDLLTAFFIFVPALLFLVFYSFPKEKFFAVEKLKRLAIFFLGVILISLPVVMSRIISFLVGFGVKQQLLGTFVSFGKKPSAGFQELFKSTSLTLFVFLPISFLGIFRRGFKENRRILIPLGAILSYFLLFQLSYALGINPITNALFPHRSFWLFPLMLGGLVAVFLKKLPKDRLIEKSLVGFLILLMFVAGIFGDFKSPTPFYQDHPPLSPGLIKFLRGEFYPFKLENLFKQWQESGFRESLEVPFEQLEIQDVNHRIYNPYSEIRIFWNIFYPMPQVTGYYMYRNRYSTHWFAWFDAVFSQKNLAEGGIKKEIALPQSLFLADWFGVRYLLSQPGEDKEIAPYFYQDKPYIKSKTGNQAPAVIELSSEYISEIARPSNSLVLAFVGSDQSYDYFLRNLGVLNLNSNYLIPVRLARFVEDLSAKKLKGIDGLIIYDFKKKGSSRFYQAAWERLETYVKKGGVIFVGAGGNCPESYGEKIPGLWPISQMESGSLGADWQIQSDFFTREDFDLLSPLVYEEDIWQLSFVPNDNFLKKEAKVLLRQKERAILVEMNLGRGKILWSGLNLIYRPHYYQETVLAEVRILEKVLKEFVPLEKQKVNFSFSRPKPEKVILNFNSAKGVLLKENNYGGWLAYAYADNQKVKLPVLSAGPDFMYAPLPKEFLNKEVKVEFVYKGIWYYWLFYSIAVLTLIFLFGLVILNQKFFNFLFLPVRAKIRKIRKKTKEKWEDDR